MKIENQLIRWLSVTAAVVFGALCLTCCDGTTDGIDDEPDGPEDPNEQVDKASLNVLTKTIGFEDEMAAERSVTVRSNREWTFETADEWIHGRKEDDNTLIVSVDENYGSTSRTGSIDVVVTEELRHTITVTQLGWEREMVLSSESVEIEVMGGETEVTVTANIEVEAVWDASWVRRIESTRAHPMEAGVWRFAVENNTGDNSRTAVVTFREKSDNEPISKRFTIVQQGMSNYTPDSGTVEWNKDDIVVKVVRAEGPASQSGHEIEKSFDGNKNTYYHSVDMTSYPQALTYYFDNVSLDYMIVTPQSGYTGRFRNVDIEVLTDANTRAEDEWQPVMSYDFADTAQPVKVVFPERLIGVKALRLNVGEIPSWNISVAEIEFYAGNPENFDYTTLFTDPSCSELREGVTEQDIDNCPLSFYRRIAYYMYHDRYPREFRIADYKAVDNPTVQSSKEMANPYSRLDDMTGMVVDAGEELVVLADVKGRTDVKLGVVMFDRAAEQSNGINTIKEFPLQSGVNRITMPQHGHLYVQYKAPDDWRTAPEVRVHFASGGKVQGYYDSQNPALAKRGRELLNNARSYRTFDAVGRFSHLVFEVGQFKSYTSDMENLMNIYDEIMYRSQVFLGLKRHRDRDDMRHNRLVYNICWDNSNANMYTSNYYVSVVYKQGNFVYALQDPGLRSERCQVVVHELGHVHQFPFIRMGGDFNEISNNILQMYIVREYFGGTSPIRGYDGYQIGWNKVIVPATSHHAVVYAYSYDALAPFWQLELYFGMVLGRSPKTGNLVDDLNIDPDTLSDEEYAELYDGFYPRFYDYMREYDRTHDSSAKTKSRYMTQFAVQASKAAEMDLSDFFRTWGFFTSMTGFTINEKDVQDALDEIKAMNYPKPDMAIEYITDDNYLLYKDGGAKAVVGKASYKSSTISVSGCSNVAAYEVREGAVDGKLLFIFTGDKRQAKYEEWNDKCRIYAVQADGTRLEVPIE